MKFWNWYSINGKHGDVSQDHNSATAAAHLRLAIATASRLKMFFAFPGVNGTGQLKLTGTGLVCLTASKYEPKGNIHDQPTSLPTRARTFKFVSFSC